MAQEVVGLCASGGHLCVTRYFLASRADTKPGLTISLPQLYFQGGCGKRCEEEKETEAKRVNWGRNVFWGWTAK